MGGGLSLELHPVHRVQPRDEVQIVREGEAEAGIMRATAVVIIRATARMFRAQHLLSGELFSFKRYVGALMGSR